MWIVGDTSCNNKAAATPNSLSIQFIKSPVKGYLNYVPEIKRGQKKTGIWKIVMAHEENIGPEAACCFHS